MISSGLLFPYSGSPERPRPKRVFLQVRDREKAARASVQFWLPGDVNGHVCASAPPQHTTRTFRNLQGQVESKDSGLWINSFDYTGIQHITPLVPEINDSFRTRCREDRPFCGYPWFLPVKFLSKSVNHLLFSVLSGTSSPPVFSQEELVPARPGGVSQLPGGVQAAVQRGDQLGDRQDDLQSDRLASTAAAVSGGRLLFGCRSISPEMLNRNVCELPKESYRDIWLSRNVDAQVFSLERSRRFS